MLLCATGTHSSPVRTHSTGTGHAATRAAFDTADIDTANAAAAARFLFDVGRL